MHQQPRVDPIEVIVIHDNEGPENPGGAQGLVNYLSEIEGGYHAVADNQQVLEVVPDWTEVWGNGAINGRSLDICMLHYAKDQWSDPFSVAEMQRAAVWVAAKCKMYGIPAQWLSAQQLQTPGVKGLCTHGDLTAAGFPGTMGHTDPGPYFPKPMFGTMVANAITPAPAVQHPSALDRFIQAVTTKPVKRGDKGPEVKMVQALLNNHDAKIPVNGVYDVVTAAAVLRFKKAHGLVNRNPDKVGRLCLLALLRPAT